MSLVGFRNPPSLIYKNYKIYKNGQLLSLEQACSEEGHPYSRDVKLDITTCGTCECGKRVYHQGNAPAGWTGKKS